MILKRFDSSKSRLFKSLSEKPIYIFPQKNRGKKNEEKEGKEKKKKRENFRSDHHAQQHAFLTESNSISLENSKGTCVDFHEAHTREREREALPRMLQREAGN